MQLKSLLLFAFAAIVAAQNTGVQVVINDLRALNDTGHSLETAVINADPSSTSADVALQKQFDAARKSIQQTTDDAQNAEGPIGGDDAKTIFDTLSAIVALVINSLEILGDKAHQYPAWAKTFIRGDLEKLNSTAIPFQDVFTEKAPDQYQDTAAKFRAEVQDAFTEVIEKFS